MEIQKTREDFKKLAAKIGFDLFNVDPEGMVFEKKDAKEDIQMLDTADFLKEIAIEHTINR